MAKNKTINVRGVFNYPEFGIIKYGRFATIKKLNDEKK